MGLPGVVQTASVFGDAQLQSAGEKRAAVGEAGQELSGFVEQREALEAGRMILRLHPDRPDIARVAEATLAGHRIPAAVFTAGRPCPAAR